MCVRRKKHSSCTRASEQSCASTQHFMASAGQVMASVSILAMCCAARSRWAEVAMQKLPRYRWTWSLVLHHHRNRPRMQPQMTPRVSLRHSPRFWPALSARYPSLTSLPLSSSWCRSTRPTCPFAWLLWMHAMLRTLMHLCALLRVCVNASMRRHCACGLALSSRPQLSRRMSRKRRPKRCKRTKLRL